MAISNTYFECMDIFKNELSKQNEIDQLGLFYNKTNDEVIKAIRPYIIRKGSIEYSVTKIWIDFTETNSGIKVKFSMNFNQ